MKFMTSLFLIFSAFITSMAHAVVIPEPPELSAKGYVLMDFNSGIFLHKTMPMCLLHPPV